jgi:hypothetical protein
MLKNRCDCGEHSLRDELFALRPEYLLLVVSRRNGQSSLSAWQDRRWKLLLLLVLLRSTTGKDCLWLAWL